MFRIDSISSKKEFIKNLKKLSKEIRSDKKGSINSMMPNDPEIKIMKIRNKNGIPLTQEIKKDLINLSDRFKVKIKLFNE